MAPTAREQDREETVLPSPRVQATVDGAAWKGTSEVLLEQGPRLAVSLECLFDQGIEAGAAAVAVSEPGRVQRLLADGKVVAGRGTRATFFDNNDGAKVLVTWRPEMWPVADIGAGSLRGRSSEKGKDRAGDGYGASRGVEMCESRFGTVRRVALGLASQTVGRRLGHGPKGR